jgi:hypothetical protein
MKNRGSCFAFILGADERERERERAFRGSIADMHAYSPKEKVPQAPGRKWAKQAQARVALFFVV